jgi:hypothetical protein
MTNLQKFPQCYPDLYAIRLELLDDSIGRLLEAYCLSDERLTTEQGDRSEKALLYWIGGFSAKYVQLIEAKFNSSLLGAKRKPMSGAFARSSMNRHVF